MVFLAPMTVPEARRDPRLRRYPLRRLRLPLGGGTLSMVVPGPGAWLAQRSLQAAAGAEPPYWADLWPASLAIARWLGRRSLHGCSCLDLGCGLGLPGAAAVRSGAAVTFADRSPEALAFAAFNAARAIGDAPAPQCLQFDWRRDTLADRFDLICLADVTYRVVHHLPLLRQVRHALGDEGLVLHADPWRPESGGFLALLRKEFAVEEQPVQVVLGRQRLAVRLVLAARTVVALGKWSGSRR